jgi:hypothetical protein
MKSLNLFANNEFNANLFYGLEQDDHGQTRQQKPPQQQQEVMEQSASNTLSPQRWLFSKISHQHAHPRQKISSHGPPFASSNSDQERAILKETTLNQETTWSDEDIDSDDEDDGGDDGPTSFRLLSTGMNPNSLPTTSKSKALSSNEMMALFGMAPPSEAGTTITGDSSSSHPVTSCIVNGNEKDDSHNQQSSVNKDGAGGTDCHHPKPNGFYLPPAETSSSDEESRADKS